MIPGDYGFINQQNENRHLTKRPSEFPRVGHVRQPFDPNKFNFAKVRQDEVLFRFEKSTENMEATNFESISIQPSDPPSIVVINVSPIVLLIPKVLECLPQRFDKESLLLALQMAVAFGNPYFRLGYSSLGAFATINHLHFQAYFLAMPFPVEKAATHLITSVEGTDTKIYLFVNYPIRSLIFEDDNSLEDLSDAVSKACIFLQSDSISYNVLISYYGKRVFVYPQCYAEKKALGEVSQELLDPQVNPGVREISVHLLLKRKEDYEEATEENAWRLLAEVSISEERFQEVKSYILEAVSPFEEIIVADDEQIVDLKSTCEWL